MYVVDLPPERLLALHDHTHSNGLGLEVGLQAAHLRSVPLRMGENKHARDAFHGLKRQRFLPLQFLPPAFASFEKLGVAIFRLDETPFGTRKILLHICSGFANFLVCFLEQLRE